MTGQPPFALPPSYKYSNKSFVGGEGTVYLFTDVFLARQVAVKVLNRASISGSLNKELKALSQIESRHVVEAYDLISLASGHSALVEEYVSGPRLDECASSLKDEQLIPVLWQIACGVADIHRHKRIHRDLKPENIKQDVEGVWKILDFGLSAEDGEAVTIRARGTYYYAGPELFGIAPVKLNQAYDVYAIAVIAWFVAGKGRLPPFLSSLKRKDGALAKSFRDIRPSTSSNLVSLIDSSLEIDPEKRPTSAELKEALEAELLYGLHRAQLTYSGTKKILAAPGDRATMTSGADSITISYDGYTFLVMKTAGDVYVNNQPADKGQELPGSCVITLGAAYLGPQRTFVAVDMSHPGVVI